MLSYLCNTVPNLDKLKRNLSLLHLHMDKMIICIGQRDEKAEAFVKSFANATLVYYPWADSFRDAYQACLDHAPKEGWHLRLDDDEVPTLEMLREIRALSENPHAQYDVVEFPCINVTDDRYEHTDYCRELLYKWNPDLHYEVSLHQSLSGLRGPKARSPKHYLHYKSPLGALKSACRDFFIAGVWADHEESFLYWHKETGQDPRRHPERSMRPEPEGIPFPLQDGFRIDAWDEMKDILERNHPEVKYYKDLDALLYNGAICQEFQEWAERHSEENDTRPHIHELHAFQKYITWRKQTNGPQP